VLKDAAQTRLVKPISFFTRATRQGRNYTTLVGWLLYTAWGGRTSKLTISMLLSLAHLGAQAAAIYAIYRYARQMEGTGSLTVPILHVTLNFKEQPQWLWVVVIFSTICFVASAAFLYLSRRQIIDVVEKRYARILEELVLLSRRLPDSRARLASDLFMEYGLSHLTAGARRGILTAVVFATAVTGVIGGIGAAAFLFWIDYSLTLLILISVGLGALLLYPLALRAVQIAKKREKAQDAFRAELRELEEKWSVEQTVLSIETADVVARSYMMRRRVSSELIFAIEIGITVIIGLVVYYMASEALAGRQQWAIFIAYIASLRMALSGAAQPIRAFASVSRYYPQIVRYYLFVKDMQRLETTPLAEVRCGDTLILGTLPNGEDVTVKVGNLLAVTSFEPTRRLQHALMHARLRHATAPVATTRADRTGGIDNNAPIAIVDLHQLETYEKGLLALQGDLANKVTLIVYPRASKVGAFGEQHVLTLFDGAFQRFALLGTEEGDAALEEFSLNAARRRTRRGAAVVDDDDDEDDEDI
jgi:hypothetical protein